MVSLHTDQYNDSAEKFLCSGVFVAPSVVLTVKHAFEHHRWRQLWVRPQVDRSPAMPIVCQPVFHPTLDAAWFRIGSTPRGATSLAIDRRVGAAVGPVYRLHAYFNNTLERDLQRTVAAFDAQNSWYTTEPLHQHGMSGGALCRLDALWALMTERYQDPAVNRGCAIAMHQLWEGFLDAIPELAEVRSQPGSSHARDGTDSGHELLLNLQTVIRRLFDREPLCDLAWAQPIVDGIPDRMLRTLTKGRRDLGKGAVNQLVELVDAINDGVRDGDLVLTNSGAARLKQCLLHAMGLATRLCLDPRQLPLLQGVARRLEVPASRQEGALIAVRERPDLAWTAHRVDGGPPSFKDGFAAELALEAGVGADLFFGLASLVASMPSSHNPTAKSTVVNSRNVAEWRSFLTDERARGRGRCLMLHPSQLGALGPDVESRLEHFGITVVAMLGDVSELFWFEEDLLLGRVQGFLHSIQKQPHWNIHDAA